MQQDTPNTFSFNNFKPYGEKMQTFSKKPITLIYGPNSIGKSSLIHMMMYTEYIFRENSFDLKKTSMFGDMVDLGGFGKLVYKRDLSKELNIEFQIDNINYLLYDLLFPDAEISYKDRQGYFDFTQKISKVSKDEIKEIFKEFLLIKFFESNSKNLKEYDTQITKFLRVVFEQTMQESDKYLAKKTMNEIVELLYENFLAKIEKLEMEHKAITLLNDYNIEHTLQTKITVKYDEILNQTRIKKILHKIDNVPYSEEESHSILDGGTLKSITTRINTKDITSGFSKLFSELCEIKYNSPFLKNIIQGFIEEGEDPSNLIYKDQRERSLDLKTIDKEILKSLNIQASMYTGVMFSEEIDKFTDNDKEKENIGSKSFWNASSMISSQISSIFLSSLHDIVTRKGIHYIGPLRFYPNREDRIKNEDSIKQEEYFDSKNFWQLIKDDDDLREKINNWLKDENKLKTPYKLKLNKLISMEEDLVNAIKKKNEHESFGKASSSMIYKLGEERGKNAVDDILNTAEMQTEFDKIVKSLEDKKFTNKKYKTMHVLYKMLQLKSFRSFLLDLLIGGGKKQWSQFKDMRRNYKSLDDKFDDFTNKIRSEDISAEYELVFKDLRTGTNVNNMDIGLGITQILPILAATNSDIETTIAIEQPELHLHPAIQAELADEFIRSYKENNNEFMIETHSEHLLLRIMRRMRHTAENKEGRDKTLDLTPDDVCLLYVDSDDESTYIKELRLSKKGKLLDHWPGGFFEEGYKERFQ